MKILMGVFFAFIPALLFGCITAFISPILGLIVGLGVFGFGMDCCFNGSGVLK